MLDRLTFLSLSSSNPFTYNILLGARHSSPHSPAPGYILYWYLCILHFCTWIFQGPSTDCLQRETQKRDSIGGSDQSSPLANPQEETLTIFAVDFIRTIDTISDTVTLPAAMDAATILTLKLVRLAGLRSYRGQEYHRMKPAKMSLVDIWKTTEHAVLIRQLLTTVDLITAILAVGIPVTSPLPMDALSWATLDLTGCALAVYHWLAATLLQGLVRLVRAVCIVVAHPADGDTGGSAALELVGTTGWGGTVELIAAIVTVILAIAHKFPGDAAATGASELIRATRYVAYWERGGPMESVSGLVLSRLLSQNLTCSSLIMNPSFLA